MLDYAAGDAIETEGDLNEPMVANEGGGLKTSRLAKFAETEGDVSELLDDQELATLGAEVCEGYETDLASINDWRNNVRMALEAATQSKPEDKNYPWNKASNVNYPIITVAAQQFAGRAYPAIVKGDEVIGVKVIGEKPEQPAMPPQGQEVPPEAQAQIAQAMQAYQQRVQQYEAKESRAKRVKTYLNYRLFYGMRDFEADIDALLNQLPIVGMAFMKVYRDPSCGVVSEFVSALHLTVHMDTTDLERCPRVTQDFELYPYEIEQRMRGGVYRTCDLTQDEQDQQAPRTILEQHRLHDLDGDGLEEPYVVTVDKESQQVLRIEAAYGPEDVHVYDLGSDNERVKGIVRWMPYVAFPFMPDPKGRFYGLGFGQLLGPLNEVINTIINQLLDAGHAANAGGGFIAAGVRFQGNGQTNVVRFQPGEYKLVNSPGNDLRGAIVEKTLPNPSPVLFQMLDLILGAAKDIAAIKDVLTGDAPSTAPVGTTLALIEQGLQSFTAIYKRVYRSLKDVYRRIYQCEGRWGGEESAASYAEILDDPQANFAKDFQAPGHDIMPVSDPTVVTKAQQLAKAQFAMQFMGQPFADSQAIMLRALEAADIDNPDQLVAKPGPPPPMMMAEVDKVKSETALNLAKADQAKGTALKNVADAGKTAGETPGAPDGQQAEPLQPGRPADMAGRPDDPMGAPGPAIAGGGLPGPMDQPDLGAGPALPAGPV